MMNDLYHLGVKMYIYANVFIYVKCIKLIVLFVVFIPVYSEDECIKSSVSTCSDCIKSGPGCTWCKDLVSRPCCGYI